MSSWNQQRVVVIGLGASGRAAASLLRRRGAEVVAVDEADTPRLREEAVALRGEGVEVRLGAGGLPEGSFDLAVLSPGVPPRSVLAGAARRRKIPCVGELELGFQESRCLTLAITGTNGKTTTTELVERILTHAGRRTVAAGNIGLPICAVADRTRELDYLTVEVSSFQLESMRYFRPVVAVLTNLTPDHLDRYAGMAEYARAKGRVFENQQLFDWAIVQSEALAQLRSFGVEPPSKVITFSAGDRGADLWLDRGLITSRMPDWAGPLFDMGRARLRGPHNAENVMAALAVGHVLRIPLEEMVAAVESHPPAAHRCEWVAEREGVTYVNDSKATNLDAVARALQAAPAGRGGEPNVWLIAGGRDKGFDFHDIGPLLSRRVKGAFLLGETREKIRAAWGLFTPCTLVGSLLEAVQLAAASAVSGDVVLLSPACSSFDMFQNYQHRGDVFRNAVRQVTETTTGTEPGFDVGVQGAAILPERSAQPTT